MATRPDPIFKVGDEVAVFHPSFGSHTGPAHISKVVKANKLGIELSCGMNLMANGREKRADRWSRCSYAELATTEHRSAIADERRRNNALAIIYKVNNWREHGLSTDALVRIAEIIKNEVPE